MEIEYFEDRDAWMVARRGRITGSTAKDISPSRGGAKKIGFYELVAARLGIAATSENAMDRGTRLEPEALQAFADKTEKKLDTRLVIWSRSDNPDISVSPDAMVEGEPAAVEAKCLSSARHIEALLTQEVPDEYQHQKLQYFIVNDLLEVLYFAFYDPRVLVMPFFFLTIHREDVQEEVDAYLAHERQVLLDVAEAVNKLTF